MKLYGYDAVGSNYLADNVQADFHFYVIPCSYDIVFVI